MWETLAQAVINGLLIGGIYALVSIGVTLIFGVVKIVNFAQGEFVMIGMYISFFLATQFGIDPLVSLVVSMPALFLAGVLIQHFLIRRVLGPNVMPQIFLTFALSLIAFAIFAAGGAVAWGPAAVMALGTVVGGYAGAPVARRIPRDKLRLLIAIVGFGMTAIFFWRLIQGA